MNFSRHICRGITKRMSLIRHSGWQCRQGLHNRTKHSIRIQSNMFSQLVYSLRREAEKTFYGNEIYFNGISFVQPFSVFFFSASYLHTPLLRESFETTFLSLAIRCFAKTTVRVLFNICTIHWNPIYC